MYIHTWYIWYDIIMYVCIGQRIGSLRFITSLSAITSNTLQSESIAGGFRLQVFVNCELKSFVYSWRGL